MKSTETSLTMPTDTFQLNPLRFYACLSIYLFAFLFKVQILSLFWGVFLFVLITDAIAKPNQFKKHRISYLYRLMLCGLFTIGFATGSTPSVAVGNLLAAIYVGLSPRPQIIDPIHIKRYRIVTLIALGIMTITLYTHGLIINI